MTPEIIQVQLRERVRLDVFLTRRLAHVSRHRIQRHILAGDVLVNGCTVRPSYPLQGGETITIPQLEARRLEKASEAVEFQIVYEDADLAVVDKPAGLLVHPVGREFRRTLLNGLHHRIAERGEDPGGLGVVHRLDRLTSGLIVFAKTLDARRTLSGDVEHRRMHRTYLALCAGLPPSAHGSIDLQIRRDPARPTRMQALRPDEVEDAMKAMTRSFVSTSGYSDPRLDWRPRTARTHWRVLRRFAGAALVRMTLETGRTHQIRVHAQGAGWPLLGDPLYGPEDAQLSSAGAHAVQAHLDRPALHAARLEFRHPRTQERMVLRAALPADFRRAVAMLAAPH